MTGGPIRPLQVRGIPKGKGNHGMPWCVRAYTADVGPVFFGGHPESKNSGSERVLETISADSLAL